MINTKEEFLEAVKNKKVLCARISLGREYYHEEWKHYILKIEHSELDYDNFLSQLNFEYDDDYGTQYLHGYVWLENEQWLSRSEYDGREWWVCNRMPIIPNECY
jgi:hypothetical protein